MVKFELVRAFVDEDERGGGAVAVTFDAVPPGDARTRLTGRLNETHGIYQAVFIDDRQLPALDIQTPGGPLGFSGACVLGAAWVLREHELPWQLLHTLAGRVEISDDGPWMTVRAREEWSPPWKHLAAADAEEVDGLSQPPDGHDFVQVWGWIDKSAGRVRARVFAPRIGIPEDEACGSASSLLAASLKRPIEVRHGDSSLIFARPIGNGWISVSGLVAHGGTIHLDVEP